MLPDDADALVAVGTLSDLLERGIPLRPPVAGLPACSARCSVRSGLLDSLPRPGVTRSLTREALGLTWGSDAHASACNQLPWALRTRPGGCHSRHRPNGGGFSRPYPNYLCVKTRRPPSRWGGRGDARARLIHVRGAWARAGVREVDAGGACPCCSVHARVRPAWRPDHPGRVSRCPPPRFPPHRLVSAHRHGSRHTGLKLPLLCGVRSRFWDVHLCRPESHGAM